MDLEQFRTLVAVAETGGISSAARRRHLSQPAVSLQIKALEQELEIGLVHRGSRGVTLTRAGEALLSHARHALAAVRSAEAEVAEVRGLRTGTLRLGTTDAAATGILPQAFFLFHRRYPGIEVSVEVESTAGLLSGLREGRFDLALGTLPVPDPDVMSFPVIEETLILVTPPRSRKTPLVKLLDQEPFIAYPRGSNTRRLVDAALDAAELPVRPVMEIGRPGVMVSLVEAGLGVSVLPMSVIQPALAEGAVHQVPTRRFRVPRTLGLLRLLGRDLEPAARAFADALTPKE